MASKAIWLVALAVGLSASTVSATAVGGAPEAIYTAELGKYANFSTQSFSGIGSYTDGKASAELGATPSPFVHIHGAGSHVALFTHGTAKYYVGVDGPVGTVVPISVAYRMSGSVQLSNGAYDGGTTDYLTLLSYDNSNNLLSIRQIQHSGNFDVSANVGWAVQSGTFGSVELSAIAVFVANEDTNGVTPYGIVDGFVDPVFTIDSAFALAHPDYRLIFSPGVGNSPGGAVPEPAVWALMASGFGLVGALKRRSLRRHTVAA